MTAFWAITILLACCLFSSYEAVTWKKVTKPALRSLTPSNESISATLPLARSVRRKLPVAPSQDDEDSVNSKPDEPISSTKIRRGYWFDSARKKPPRRHNLQTKLKVPNIQEAKTDSSGATLSTTGSPVPDESNASLQDVLPQPSTTTLSTNLMSKEEDVINELDSNSFTISSEVDKKDDSMEIATSEKDNDKVPLIKDEEPLTRDDEHNEIDIVNPTLNETNNNNTPNPEINLDDEPVTMKFIPTLRHRKKLPLDPSQSLEQFTYFKSKDSLRISKPDRSSNSIDLTTNPWTLISNASTKTLATTPAPNKLGNSNSYIVWSFSQGNDTNGWSYQNHNGQAHWTVHSDDGDYTVDNIGTSKEEDTNRNDDVREKPNVLDLLKLKDIEQHKHNVPKVPDLIGYDSSAIKSDQLYELDDDSYTLQDQMTQNKNNAINDDYLIRSQTNNPGIDKPPGNKIQFVDTNHPQSYSYPSRNSNDDSTTWSQTQKPIFRHKNANNNIRHTNGHQSPIPINRILFDHANPWFETQTTNIHKVRPTNPHQTHDYINSPSLLYSKTQSVNKLVKQEATSINSETPIIPSHNIVYMENHLQDSKPILSQTQKTVPKQRIINIENVSATGPHQNHAYIGNTAYHNDGPFRPQTNSKSSKRKIPIPNTVNQNTKSKFDDLHNITGISISKAMKWSVTSEDNNPVTKATYPTTTNTRTNFQHSKFKTIPQNSLRHNNVILADNLQVLKANVTFPKLPSYFMSSNNSYPKNWQVLGNSGKEGWKLMDVKDNLEWKIEFDGQKWRVVDARNFHPEQVKDLSNDRDILHVGRSKDVKVVRLRDTSTKVLNREESPADYPPVKYIHADSSQRLSDESDISQSDEFISDEDKKSDLPWMDIPSQHYNGIRYDAQQIMDHWQPIVLNPNRQWRHPVKIEQNSRLQPVSIRSGDFTYGNTEMDAIEAFKKLLGNNANIKLWPPTMHDGKSSVNRVRTNAIPSRIDSHSRRNINQNDRFRIQQHQAYQTSTTGEPIRSFHPRNGRYPNTSQRRQDMSDEVRKNSNKSRNPGIRRNNTPQNIRAHSPTISRKSPNTNHDVQSIRKRQVEKIPYDYNGSSDENSKSEVTSTRRGTNPRYISSSQSNYQTGEYIDDGSSNGLRTPSQPQQQNPIDNNRQVIIIDYSDHDASTGERKINKKDLEIVIRNAKPKKVYDKIFK